MRNSALTLFLLAAGLSAQTVESIPFRAVLSPRNETPAITDLTASGVATVWLHVVRDAAGQVTSGSVDFQVRYDFPGEVTFTGMHIHRGAAGVNGPVTIGAIGGAAGPSVTDSTGKGSIERQAAVTAAGADGLETIRGMLQDPSGYYLNLHTPAYPAGVMRGQLMRADRLLLMARMSPANEVPAIAGLDASGLAAVTILASRTADGAITSAEVRFDASYRFPGDVTLTGFHIHPGAAGSNGPVAISSGLRSQPSGAGGSGSLSFTVDATTDAATLNALYGLFASPGDLYINLHTTANPGGAMRGQLRPADMAAFPLTLSAANEVPVVSGLDASAPALLTAETIRNADGSVDAGLVTFDVNYRFPGAVEFTGMHIHDQVAGQNGPVTIGTNLSSANSVASDTGFGNLYRTVLVGEGQALTSLNSVLQNPEKHYANLHSRANPAGVVRAQLAAANTAMPAVGAVISAVSNPSLRVVAPGGLMTIFGTNITKVAGSARGVANGDGAAALNGTEVTVGGTRAPITLLAPGFVVVQVPVDAKVGTASVAVKNSNGAGAAASVQIAAVAPAIYYDSVAGIAFRVSDMTILRPDNPALAGEPIAILATGLGATQPALETGKAAPPSPFYMTAPVAVSIGGRSAAVVGSAAVPGFLGQYLVVAQVPPATGTGNQAVTLSMGDATSNTVQIPVRGL